jgi:hypothetical protein
MARRSPRKVVAQASPKRPSREGGPVRQPRTWLLFPILLMVTLLAYQPAGRVQRCGMTTSI